MNETVNTPEQAKQVLEYFNAFHDGFVQHLTIQSHDRFQDRGVQSLSGRLDIEIVFAHYNYGMGEPPASQLVRARFHKVRDIEMSLRGRSYEWSVNFVEIQETTRQDEADQPEACLLLSLSQNRLNERREWELHEDIHFTFTQAEFAEI